MTDPNQPWMLPSPRVPMEVARDFACALYTHETGALVLRHWRGGWWQWRTSHWVEVEQRAVQGRAYEFTEHAVYVEEGRRAEPWAPNRHKIADLLDALAAVCHLPEHVAQPAWIDGRRITTA